MQVPLDLQSGETIFLKRFQKEQIKIFHPPQSSFQGGSLLLFK
jgi:hypothetical protein